MQRFIEGDRVITSFGKAKTGTISRIVGVGEYLIRIDGNGEIAEADHYLAPLAGSETEKRLKVPPTVPRETKVASSETAPPLVETVAAIAPIEPEVIPPASTPPPPEPAEATSKTTPEVAEAVTEAPIE